MSKEVKPREWNCVVTVDGWLSELRAHESGEPEPIHVIEYTPEVKRAVECFPAVAELEVKLANTKEALEFKTALFNAVDKANTKKILAIMNIKKALMLIEADHMNSLGSRNAAFEALEFLKKEEL
jgi:hypothetical protein